MIYPKSNLCIICKKEGEGICAGCKSSIKFCNDDELILGYYTGVIKELILKFKFNKDFNAGDELVKILEEEVIEKINKEFVLTYIPIGKESLDVRGFNQCEYIVKELAYRNDFKVLNTLKKIKENKVQKYLSKEERIINVKGIYEIINENEVKGKSFILFDDVITTGATIEEGKKTLLKAGAKEIKILTLAKSHI